MPSAKRSRLDEDEGNDSFEDDDYDPRPSAYLMSQRPHLSQMLNERGYVKPEQVEPVARVVKPMTPRRKFRIEPQTQTGPTGKEMLMKNQIHNEKRLRERMEKDNADMRAELIKKEREFEAEKRRLENAFRLEQRALKNQITTMSFDQSRLNASTSASQMDMNNSNVLNETTSSSPAIPSKKIAPQPPNIPAPSGFANSGFQGGFKMPFPVRANESFAHMPSQSIPLERRTIGERSDFLSPPPRKQTTDTSAQTIEMNSEKRVDFCRERGLAELVFAISNSPNASCDPKAISKIVMNKNHTTLGQTIFQDHQIQRSTTFSFFERSKYGQS